MMDTLELDRRLRETGHAPGNYSIGAIRENAIILLLEDHVWKVFFFERGQRGETTQFKAESDACQFMLETIVSWEGKYSKQKP